jgi:hypothetical protein
MSRGILTQETDEKCAIYAIGEAINLLAIDLMHEQKLTYKTYEEARNSITENMSFWLCEQFKKSKYFG